MGPEDGPVDQASTVEAGNILRTLQDKLQCLTHRVVPVVREVGDIGEVLYNCRGERTWTIMHID